MLSTKVLTETFDGRMATTVDQQDREGEGEEEGKTALCVVN